jgi:cyclopropane-fatty-acyl-phospholipid synthase
MTDPGFPVPLEHIADGRVSDQALRVAIRFGLAAELRRQSAGGHAEIHRRKLALVHSLRAGPIAVEEDSANEQHYALPPAFFALVLGKHLKYSGGYWPNGDMSLDQSEAAMIDLVCERAQLQDGMSILDLGCGWGSFSLAAARRYPGSKVLGISNSAPQRQWLQATAREQGLTNVEFRTENVVHWAPPPGQFDRVVSVEMFEHMRNYDLLLRKIDRALAPDGKLFVHIFTHDHLTYLFADNWMSRRFFTGGLMPSDDLLLYFQNDLSILDHWRVDGSHYQKTSDAWLERLDSASDEALAIFMSMGMTREQARIFFTEWRLFFLSCSESFGFEGGNQYMVSHYLFGKRT